ncbi:MAG: hypothetical protein M3O85_08380 [Acidobacteriota bacterium]|nr:hypothetical protein [Acidobacteriota bacterium]
MRWSRLPVLLLMGASCLAQTPKRAELTATPKFMKDPVQPSFQSFTEAQLRAAIKIISARNYAVFGYNTPEVRLKLPQVSNSTYSTVEFSPATLVDAAGQEMAFEVEEGGYNKETFSDELRFSLANSDKIIDFAHARGHVKLKYPLVVKTSTITRGQPGPPELAVKIDGPFVSFAEDEAKIPEIFFMSKLQPIRAYDGAGRQLEPYGSSETEEGMKRIPFYGNVARVEIDTVDSWAELDLPYDFTASPLLPAGHEGEDPEAPPQ